MEKELVMQGARGAIRAESKANGHAVRKNRKLGTEEIDFFLLLF